MQRSWDRTRKDILSRSRNLVRAPGFPSLRGAACIDACIKLSVAQSQALRALACTAYVTTSEDADEVARGTAPAGWAGSGCAVGFSATAVHDRLLPSRGAPG